jgi:hypothetical protein
LCRLIGVLAIAGGIAAVPSLANAASPRPTITNFKISVKALLPEGGKFTLSATVANATTCTFKVTPALAGFPVSVPCGGSGNSAVGSRAKGIIKINSSTVPNALGGAIHHTFSLSATNATGPTTSAVHPSLTQHAYRWVYTTKSLSLKGSATSISCAGKSFCVVVSSKGTLAVLSTKSRNTNLTDVYVFRSVSCASPTMCVAVDSTGTFVAWNGAKWSSPTSVPTGSSGTAPDLVSTSCPTSTFCMALDSGGDAYSITPKPPHGTIMQSRALGQKEANPLVSCSSATACLLTDQAGDAVGWNGKTWTTIGVVDTAGGVTALSCAPGGTCTIVDSHGGVVTVTVGYKYSKKLAIADNQRTVSCPTPGYCLVTDNLGQASQEVKGVWSPPFTIGNDPPVALSCGVGKTSPVGVTCAAVSHPGNSHWGVIKLK